MQIFSYLSAKETTFNVTERFFSIWRSNHTDGSHDRHMLLSHQKLFNEGWRKAGSQK